MALIELKDITMRFGGLTAVGGLSASLEEGEIVGLIGPNGAGKTTVFNITSGFYTPTEGRVLFDGQDITGMKPHKVSAAGIARTFQNIRLWPQLTVLDNIRIAQHHRLGYGLFDLFRRSKRHRRREHEITTMGLRLLDHLDMVEFADEVPANLPYGLQRKVEIARALSVGPKLLLLDEPAAGLSSADVVGLIDLIRFIHKEFNLTIWMIEHQMTVVMSLCQRMQVIDFGREIAAGGPEEIQGNPEVIKAYLGDTEL